MPSASYPSSCVWYIESRRWNNTEGKLGTAGSGVVVALERLDHQGRPLSPPEIKKYLLTAGHVVREHATGPLFDELLCWEPGRGYSRLKQRSKGEAAVVGASLAKVSTLSPCGAQQSSAPSKLAADDWVLLEVEGAAFQAQPPVEQWADGVGEVPLMAVGYPGGAGLEGQQLWVNGYPVAPRDSLDFRYSRSEADPGMYNYEGPEDMAPGMSGGGIFDRTQRLVAIHRSALGMALQRHAVSASHIRSWLFNRGYRPALFPDSRPITIGTNQAIGEARFFDDCYVDRYPMVNRTELRKKLRSVVTEEGKRILVVKGHRFSGKSHTVRHIRHVAGRLGISLAEFPLVKFATGEDLQPHEFGDTIAQALKRKPPKLAKTSRWSTNFINWLAAELDPNRDKLWIVFDDFEKEKLKVALPDSIYEFIQTLSEGVANRLRGVRLFLINYDRPLPNEIGFQIDREDVPGISEKDIIEFFLGFYRDHVRPDDLETAAKDAAERAHNIMSELPADMTIRLHGMRDALTAACEKLRGQELQGP